MAVSAEHLVVGSAAGNVLLGVSDAELMTLRGKVCRSTVMIIGLLLLKFAGLCVRAGLHWAQRCIR